MLDGSVEHRQDERAHCIACRRPVRRHKCGRRDCSIGARAWSRDVRRVLMAAFSLYSRFRLVVITAPGQAVLPWDTSLCTHGPTVECSGVRGCRCLAGPRDEWERTLPDRWCKLHRAALGRLRRMGYRSPLVAWVDEDQGRQVFHRNVVLEEGPAAARYQQLLAELAPHYGFGFVDRKPVVLEIMQAVNYLCGYLTGGASGKKAGRDLAAAAARIRPYRRVWVASPNATRVTGVTRRSLDAGRKVWASERGYCQRPKQGFAVIDWTVYDLASGEVFRQVWEVDDDDPPPDAYLD